MRVFKLPDLGEGLQEAEISAWRVAIDEAVELDQPLLEVETAKAIVEIPSPRAGKVRKLFGRPGDILHVGDPLVEFADGGDASADAGTVVGRVEAGSETSREAATAALRPTTLAVSLAFMRARRLNCVPGPERTLTGNGVAVRMMPPGCGA